MRYLLCCFLIISSLLILTYSCEGPSNHGHAHGDHGHGNHDHGAHGHDDHGHHEAQPLSYVLRSENTELFVEFEPLFVGGTCNFTAHFTDRNTLRPIENSQASVRLSSTNRNSLSDKQSVSTTAGIYNLTFTPTIAGNFNLIFTIETSQRTDTLSLENISVYPDKKEAETSNPAKAENEEEISYTKEQAWKVDFAVNKVSKGSINDVIRASGELLSHKGTDRIIVAKSSGIIFFQNEAIEESMTVKKDQKLFVQSSDNLSTDNLEQQFKSAKALLDQSLLDYERAEQLIQQEILAQKEFEERKATYLIAKAEYEKLIKLYNSGGSIVRSSMNGIVKKLMVSNGQFVKEGDPLITITNNRRLILKTEVSQKYYPQLSNIKSANFKTPYQNETQSISDYNGKVVSIGKLIEEDQYFLPILFELDNVGDLVSGSFVDIFLLTEPIPDALVIPKSALLQDYNSNYVYVQVSGESYEKRIVRLGVDDGINIQVLSGISEEDWIVTKGAYQVKMASMSSAIPSHGHTH